MPTPEPPAQAPDPSMEDILASIRRILADGEEEVPASPGAAGLHTSGAAEAPPPGSVHDDGVFLLDQSMEIDLAPPASPPAARIEPEPEALPKPEPEALPKPEPEPEPWTPPTPAAAARPEPHPEPPAPIPPPAPVPEPEPPVMPAAEAAPMPDFSHLDAGDTPAEPLLGATASAATSASLGALVRVVSQRQTSVYAGGPTLEDMVRAEIRPMVKTWLDEHLAPMVERLVRAEIDRVSALK